MDLDAPAGMQGDAPGEQLLVREGTEGDRRAVLELLGRAGWEPAGHDDWLDGSGTLVLYDPADGVVRGAVTVEALGAGSFQLVAWAVENVDDRDAATTRLVRAAADRLRRSGGERLIVTVEGSGVAREVMRSAGFGALPTDSRAATAPVTLYQEL